jgi:hypothetical protein
MYAHTYRDWRRTPAIGYSSRPCPHWAQSVASGPTELVYEFRCPNGMACPLAHGAKEQLYHPQFYKTSPCSENCKRGALCAFTHGDRDRRVPPDITAVDEAWAASWPIPWAVDLLQCYQPAFCNPPRYHALEEQVPRKGTRSTKAHLGTPQREVRRGRGGHKLHSPSTSSPSKAASPGSTMSPSLGSTMASPGSRPSPSSTSPGGQPSPGCPPSRTMPAVIAMTSLEDVIGAELTEVRLGSPGSLEATLAVIDRQ